MTKHIDVAEEAEDQPAGLRGGDDHAVRRTMRLSIVEGSVTQVFLNWTAGNVLTGYLIALKAGPMDLALMASMPFLGQCASPFAAWLAGVFPRRRLLTCILAGIGRSLWLIAAAIPLFRFAPGGAPAILVALIGLSAFFQASSGSIWSAWMGDIVPAERRGRYFGLRAGILSLVGMVATLFAGWFMDHVPRPLCFQLLLLIGVALALVGVGLLARHHEPAVPRSTLGFRKTFSTPLADRNFRRFLLFAFCWQASVQLGAPFVYPFLMNHMKLTFTQVAIWAALASLLTLATSPLWGRVADRVGNKPVLVISTIIAGSLLPLTWMMATPGNLTMIWLSSFMDALAWGAITPAIFNLALATAPQRDRVAYLSVYFLMTGISGFLGSAASGVIFRVLESARFTIGTFTWTGYHSVFLIAGIARCQAWRLLGPVRETNAWSVEDTLRGFGRWFGNSFPWR